LLAGHDYGRESAGLEYWVQPYVDEFFGRAAASCELSVNSFAVRMPSEAIGITIPVFRRPEGTGEAKRAIQSVLDQTDADWRIYLIGDRFEPLSEFDELCQMIPESKLRAVNLPFATERDTNPSPERLWQCGGQNAANTALRMQIEDSVRITTRLDDDDVWRPRHLELIRAKHNEHSDLMFVCGRCQDLKRIEPNVGNKRLLDLKVDSVSHCSASWRLDRAQSYYAAGPEECGDASFFAKLQEKANYLRLRCVCLDEITSQRDVRHRLKGKEERA